MEEDRVLINSHKPEHPCEAKQRQQHHRHFYTASGREKEKKTTSSYSWVFSLTACVVIGCFEITWHLTIKLLLAKSWEGVRYNAFLYLVLLDREPSTRCLHFPANTAVCPRFSPLRTFRGARKDGCIRRLCKHMSRIICVCAWSLIHYFSMSGCPI